ncbi:MAG: aspartate/glutamate racemase family protein, partial [Pseudomonadota bacterium]
MRLLIVNPNSSDDVTARIAAAADRVSQPRDVFDAVSAPSDTPLVVTRADAKRAASAVAQSVEEHAAAYDGIIIASFGDTGIEDARRVTSRPVIGIARSAFLAALACADSFSIVSFSQAMTPGFRETLKRYALSDRVREIVGPDIDDIETPGAI